MRTAYKLATVLLAAGLIGCMQPQPGAKAAHVNAKLVDRTEEMSNDFAYASGADMSKAPMTIELSASTVPAGEVVFDVSNAEADMEHEMVVSPLPANGAPLPFNSAKETVDQRAAGKVSEVEHIKPGTSKQLDVRLKPGKYIVYCNLPYHFTSGMWSVLTVTG